MKQSQKLKSYLNYPLVLTSASLVALISSIWQATERVNMLKFPNLELSCNLNPIIDCGTVMSHKLSSLFGFPNAFIGIAMFSMLFFAGILMMSGTKFTKNALILVLGFSVIAFLFSVWFFGVSLYVIGKACIFCLFIWPSSVTIFWTSLLNWLKSNHPNSELANKLLKLKLEIYIAVLAAMFALFLYRFRDYYFNN